MMFVSTSSPRWAWTSLWRKLPFSICGPAHARSVLGLLHRTTALTTGEAIHARKFEQTIRSELVWRFNWGGPVRAPY